jgi:hypothetical protein
MTPPTIPNDRPIVVRRGEDRYHLEVSCQHWLSPTNYCDVQRVFNVMESTPRGDWEAKDAYHVRRDQWRRDVQRQLLDQLRADGWRLDPLRSTFCPAHAIDGVAGWQDLLATRRSHGRS